MMSWINAILAILSFIALILLLGRSVTRVKNFQILTLGHSRALDVQINHLDDILFDHKDQALFETCDCYDRLRKLRHTLELIQEDSENAADFKFDFENKRHINSCEFCIKNNYDET